MICNGKLYSAYIATKSGVNPVALLDKRGKNEKIYQREQ